MSENEKMSLEAAIQKALDTQIEFLEAQIQNRKDRIKQLRKMKRWTTTKKVKKVEQ